MSPPAQLQTVQIAGVRAPLDPNLPSSTASKTAEQLREQNVYNPKTLPSTCPAPPSRKRYMGDRNANVAGRSYGTLQPGRLGVPDGYLISNFLGRFDAPRWNMVNVESIEAHRRAVRPVLGHLPRQFDPAPRWW